MVLGCGVRLLSVIPPSNVHYLPYDEVRDLIRDMVNAGAPDLPSHEIKDAASWNSWIQSRDSKIRGRIDLGIED